MMSGFSGLLPRKAGIPNFRKSLLTVAGLTSQLIGGNDRAIGDAKDKRELTSLLSELAERNRDGG